MVAEQPADLSAPDLSEGIDASEVPDEGSVYGRVGTEPVVLSRFDGLYFAVGGACTHYGAALKDGLQQRALVRCPLHHACFDLRTGEALMAPAFRPLGRWKVEQDGATLYVREKEAAAAAPPARHGSNEVERVVILGGGAAGFACAHRLRRLGYDGGLVIISADDEPPYDRPNLTKDYLAGTAPDAWMPLAGRSWYEKNRIALRLKTEAVGLDPRARTVALAGGELLPYDRLLIATGAAPIRPAGFAHENAHLLRSMADARRILARLGEARHVALLGAGFIGLEAAAALRQRGLEVDIVSNGTLPFDGLFGHDVALFLKDLHERNGARFRLGETALGFDGRTLELGSGGRLETDLLLLGVGVRPNVALAERAGLAVEDGIVVDEQLRTSAADVFAAGDVANYPELGTGRRLRVEHWVTAQQQGETVAFNMLGENRAFDRVPFFWSEQYGVALRYVGYGARWTEVAIDGFVNEGQFTARYFEDWRMRASLSVGRDRDNLEEEVRLETLGETGRRARDA